MYIFHCFSFISFKLLLCGVCECLFFVSFVALNKVFTKIIRADIDFQREYTELIENFFSMAKKCVFVLIFFIGVLHVFGVLVGFYFLYNTMIYRAHPNAPIELNRSHLHHRLNRQLVRIFSILVRPLWMRPIHFPMFWLTSLWNWLRETLDTRLTPPRTLSGVRLSAHRSSL